MDMSDVTMSIYRHPNLNMIEDTIHIREPCLYLESTDPGLAGNREIPNTGVILHYKIKSKIRGLTHEIVEMEPCLTYCMSDGKNIPPGIYSQTMGPPNLSHIRHKQTRKKMIVAPQI